MQIKISSKHMEITPAIESYATKKVEKLRRFFDRIQQIDVVIDKARNGYTTEIITDVEHHEPFIATGENEDLYACIDLGVDRSIRQLKDHKSKLRDNKHHAPMSGAGLGKPGAPKSAGAPASNARPSPARAPGTSGASGNTA
jgi:putative sigma-54 modulation protein